jgi:hypothetical protein
MTIFDFWEDEFNFEKSGEKWNEDVFRKATKRKEHATEEEAISASSWRTVFGALKDYDINKSQPKRKRATYHPKRNNIRTPGIDFLTPPRIERLSLFPWRSAMVELIVKLDIYPHTRMIGRIVARLETYPPHVHPCEEEYVFYSIPKKNGEKRKISAPSEELKLLQKGIYKTLSALSQHHPASHGYEVARSNITNARMHERQPSIVRLDIKRAFESTIRQRVERAITKDLENFNFTQKALSLLSEILTYNNSLPTGSPCSPYLLNRVLYELDKLMERESSNRGMIYTRYADDLVVSGIGAEKIVCFAQKALLELGYSINKKKTRIFKASGRQTVTGLTVNDRANLRREDRRRLRAAVHQWTKTEGAHLNGSTLSLSSLKGHLSYLKAVSPESAEELVVSLTNSEML